MSRHKQGQMLPASGRRFDGDATGAPGAHSMTCHAQRATWHVLMWQTQDRGFSQQGDLRACRDQITGDQDPILEPTGLQNQEDLSSIWLTLFLSHSSVARTGKLGVDTSLP